MRPFSFSHARSPDERGAMNDRLSPGETVSETSASEAWVDAVARHVEEERARLSDHEQ
jgi:hypothetical protein